MSDNQSIAYNLPLIIVYVYATPQRINVKKGSHMLKDQRDKGIINLKTVAFFCLHVMWKRNVRRLKRLTILSCVKCFHIAHRYYIDSIEMAK